SSGLGPEAPFALDGINVAEIANPADMIGFTAASSEDDQDEYIASPAAYPVNWPGMRHGKTNTFFMDGHVTMEHTADLLINPPRRPPLGYEELGAPRRYAGLTATEGQEARARRWNKDYKAHRGLW